jgi:hypothetical protein
VEGRKSLVATAKLDMPGAISFSFLEWALSKIPLKLPKFSNQATIGPKVGGDVRRYAAKVAGYPPPHRVDQ